MFDYPTNRDVTAPVNRIPVVKLWATTVAERLTTRWAAYERQLKRREPHLVQQRVDFHGHVGVEDKLETAADYDSSLLWSPDSRLAPESEAPICASDHSLTCTITGAICSPAGRHIQTASEDDSCRVLEAESR